MKHTCKICGAPCRNKYCKDCANIGYRKRSIEKYKETHKPTENFYVFYDKNDFVRYFGTAEQLVKDGIFPTENAVRSRASKIKSGTIASGNVVILKCEVA